MFTKDNARQHGRKGGQRTPERHGRAHFQRIGRAGFQSTTEKYFDGDEQKHKQFLAELGGFHYWLQTNVAMKHDRDGRPMWRRPQHPAHRNEIPF
ncbi:MAG: hypothetical protein IPK82_23565 [Polyangiaceae bacterium]|nr:hypothetical protein [Polyangiaceae bacterium]